MKRFKQISLSLVLLLISGVAFGLIVTQEAREAMLGIKAAIDIIVGNCQGPDRDRTHRLLDSIRGCKLTDRERLVFDIRSQKKCIDLLIKKWSEIEQVSCKEQLQRGVEERLLENLIQHWEWVSDSRQKQILESRLPVYLEHLSYWENTTRSSLYLNGNAEQLYKDLSNDMNKIHSIMGRGLFNTMRASISQLDQYQLKKFSEKDAPYFLVMKGLFSQSNPGPTSLIQFTAMTLNPLFERSRLFLTLFDLGCSIKGQNCSTADYQPFEPYNVLLLTSHVIESEIPRPLLTETLGRLSTSFEETFKVIFENQDKLKTSLRNGVRRPDTPLNQLNLDDFEPLASHLVSQVKEAQQLTKNIERHGRFTLSPGEYLEGFTKEGLERENQNLRQLRDRLETKKRDFRANFESQIRSLDTINETAGKRAVIASQLQSTSLELGMARTDLFGLQTALRNDSNSLGNLVRQTTTLMNTPAYRERYANAQMVQVQSIQQSIAARDARFEIDTPPSEISRYSVNSSNQNTAVKFDLKKGDLVSVEITGQYSPTCALAKEYNNIHGLDTARTGPEGFSISESDRRLKVESSSTSVVDRDTATHTNQHTKHLEGCGSSTVGHSVSVTGGFMGSGVGYSKSWSHSTPEDCTNAITSNAHSTDHSDARTHSSSAELAQHASFEKGLRSSFAPFPSIPVGALVAVERDPVTGRIIRKHVLHRLSTFSAVSDGELYLVVNDCRSANPGSASLQVTVNQKRSPINPGVIS
jgi:hypothetical protein